MQFPYEVEEIFRILKANGFHAYAVGGCVRDALLGRSPYDYDVATDALPAQVLELFYDQTAIPTGIQHGTVTIVMGGRPVEITTFRRDGVYTDNRRPSSVTYSKELRDDLARRDFTVNAMAYDSSEGIVDCFGGVADLKDGLIRSVGNSDDRFGEDALRLLRAIRLAAQLGFRIEEKTAEGIHRNKHLLKNISRERINAEFSRMLLADNCAALLVQFQDVIGVFIEGAVDDPYFTEKSGRLQTAQGGICVRLALLLRGICDWRLAPFLLKELKYDNDTLEDTVVLLRYGKTRIKRESSAVRLWLNRMGKRRFFMLLQLKETEEYVQDIRDIAQGIIQRGECCTLKELAVSGNDLMQVGMRPGKEMGRVLNRLLLDVMREKLPNEQAHLMDRVKQIRLVYEQNATACKTEE